MNERLPDHVKEFLKKKKNKNNDDRISNISNMDNINDFNSSSNTLISENSNDKKILEENGIIKI